MIGLRLSMTHHSPLRNLIRHVYDRESVVPYVGLRKIKNLVLADMQVSLDDIEKTVG
jgi:hypothetical protein